MGNRRRPAQERRARHGHPAPLDPDTAGSEVGGWFNRTARKSCSECGSPVGWLTPAQAREEASIDVAGALASLGVTSEHDVEFWTCTHCDNYGAMGAAEFG